MKIDEMLEKVINEQRGRDPIVLDAQLFFALVDAAKSAPRWIPVSERLPKEMMVPCFVVITHFVQGKPTERFATYADWFGEDKCFGVRCTTRMGEDAHEIYPIYKAEDWDGNVTGDAITHYYIPTLPALPEEEE